MGIVCAIKCAVSDGMSIDEESEGLRELVAVTVDVEAACEG
jgi:hypothetical protein